MMWLKVEAGVAVRMELQGQQDVGVFAWKVNPGLKTGWGFMGCKMFSGLPEDDEVVRLERRAGVSFKMDPQDQQEAGGFGLKERQEYLSG